MGQGLASQLVIDQGRDHPDLGQAVPGRKVLHPVGKEEGDAVSRSEPGLQGPSGEAVGQAIHLPIAEAATFEADSLAVRPFPDRSPQVIADPPRTVGRNAADPTQGPGQAAIEAQVAPEGLEHAGPVLVSKDAG